MKHAFPLSVISISLLLTACAGAPHGGRVDLACQKSINKAYDELSFAKSKGFSGSVSWSKASALLGTAKVMEQVENYQGCLNNVKKARFYIQKSRGQ